MIKAQSKEIDGDRYSVEIEAEIEDSKQAFLETASVISFFIDGLRESLKDLPEQEAEYQYQMGIHEVLTNSLGDDYIKRLYHAFNPESNQQLQVGSC